MVVDDVPTMSTTTGDTGSRVADRASLECYTSVRFEPTAPNARVRYECDSAGSPSYEVALRGSGSFHALQCTPGRAFYLEFPKAWG